MADCSKCLLEHSVGGDDVVTSLAVELSAAKVANAALAAKLGTAEENYRLMRYERDVCRSQLKVHQDAASKGVGYWAWQGDGEDYLESLTCPVLIRPEALKAIIDSLAAMTVARNLHKARGDAWKYVHTCCGPADKVRVAMAAARAADAKCEEKP